MQNNNNTNNTNNTIKGTDTTDIVTKKEISKEVAKKKLLNFFIKHSNVSDVLSGNVNSENIVNIKMNDYNNYYYDDFGIKQVQLLDNTQDTNRFINKSKYQRNPQMVHICEQICNKLNKYDDISKAYNDSKHTGQSSELLVKEFLSNEIFEKKKQRNIFSKIVSFVKDTAEKIGLHPKRSLEHNLDVFIKERAQNKQAHVRDTIYYYLELSPEGDKSIDSLSQTELSEVSKKESSTVIENIRQSMDAQNICFNKDFTTKKKEKFEVQKRRLLILYKT